MNDVSVICVTGPPCSGKTTALVKIPENLSNFGFSPITVPEVPTELFSNGVKIGGDGLSVSDFQEQALLMELEKRHRYVEIAKRFKNPKRIVICDGGAMRGKAYMKSGEFEVLVKSMGFNITHLRDGLYDGVFHLVTAAIGARDFYTNSNNPFRKETLDEAALLDKLTQEAWIGCPHFRVIDNSTDFEGKMKRLLRGIYRVIGIPTPIEIERKFVVYKPDFDTIPVYVSPVDIEQPYLLPAADDFKRRIRKRGQEGFFVCYETLKKDIGPGKVHEIERKIDYAEYLKLLRDERDDNYDIIQKVRNCFCWNSQYFELDVFQEPFASRIKTLLKEDGIWFDKNRTIAEMEIELTEENDRVEAPPFVEVIKEVTGDGRYSNRALAKKR